MKSPICSSRQRGFALVVTLSLMILLTVIAVGLLTLSSISLRSSSQAEAMATARANARLALMLALGDLQKSLGPDRAVTATSEILATSTTPVAKPNTTGVWESWWDFNPNSSTAPSYSTEKTSRFRRWLVSSADMTAPESRDFVTTPWTGKTIELVGKGSVGASATAAAKVVAGLVPVSKNGRVQGSYAWHVSDESVKARINVYRDPSQNTTLAQKRALLAGHRPDPTLLKGADGNFLTCLPTDLSPAEFAKAATSVGKVVDLDQAELLDSAKGKIKQFRNDMTPYSLGVMADVRGGGLKQDLSSMFEMGSATTNTLPSDFTGKKLYATTHGITGVSDPNWSALAGYYNSFRNLTTADANPSIVAKPPETETKNGITEILRVPTIYNPGPVIAKVDTVFSMVGRPLQDIGWAFGGGAPTNAGGVYDYFVNLIFTPLVTLHNPYNVNISFHKMEVTFTNIPVAVNFMFQSGNGGGFVSQGVVQGAFEAINTMAYSSHTDFSGNKSRNNKSFVMKIADWQSSAPLASDSAISGPIIMKPGQTLICSPYFSPSASFKKDSGLGDITVGFDWRNALTSSIKAKPGFISGLGYEIYATTIAHVRLSGEANRIIPNKGYYPAGWSGHPFMMLRDLGATPKLSQSTVTDKFYLEYKVQQPGWYVDDSTVTPTMAAPKFEVTAQLQATSASSLANYAKLQFNYGTDSTIKSIFEDRTYRYPPVGSLTGSEVAAPGGVPYSNQAAYVHNQLWWQAL